MKIEYGWLGRQLVMWPVRRETEVSARHIDSPPFATGHQCDEMAGLNRKTNASPVENGEGFIDRRKEKTWNVQGSTVVWRSRCMNGHAF